MSKVVVFDVSTHGTIHAVLASVEVVNETFFSFGLLIELDEATASELDTAIYALALAQFKASDHKVIELHAPISEISDTWNTSFPDDQLCIDEITPAHMTFWLRNQRSFILNSVK